MTNSQPSPISLEGSAAVAPHSWKGLSSVERVAARQQLLINATIELLASQGDSALSIRAVAQHARLNTRYFYESFETVDDLLGVAFDQLNLELAETLERRLVEQVTVQADRAGLIEMGIRTVLEFVDGRPDRASLLFTEAQSNATLVSRRRQAQNLLMQLARQQPATAAEARAVSAGSPGASAHQRQSREDVAGPMFAGAMAELVVAWLRGDIDGTAAEVARRAAARIQRIFD